MRVSTTNFHHHFKRALCALLIGLTAFCLALIAAWRLTGAFPRHANYRISGLSRLLSVRDAVEDYRQKKGALPVTLADLTTDGTRCSRIDSRGFPLDIWGNRVTLSETDDGYCVCSLGRDGQPGGFGMDGDLCSDRPLAAERASWE